MFRYVVLGLLRRGVPYHGYALMKEYRERTGLKINTGNFYRELQRLVSEGLVETAQNPDGADQRRAPYKIMEEGAAAFDAWFSRPPVGFGSYEDELTCRANFVVEVAPVVASGVLDRWREELWITGKMVERARERALARQDDDPSPDLDSLPVLLGRRLKHIAADLEFLDELRDAFDRWVASRPCRRSGTSWPASAPEARRLSARARGAKSH